MTGPLSANDRQGFKAVHFRHHQVQDHHIDIYGFLVQKTDTGRSVQGGDHLNSLFGEIFCQQGLKPLVVINKKDAYIIWYNGQSLKRLPNRPGRCNGHLSLTNFSVYQKPCVKQKGRGNGGKGAQGAISKNRGFRSAVKGHQGGKACCDTGKQ